MPAGLLLKEQSFGAEDFSARVAKDFKNILKSDEKLTADFRIGQVVLRLIFSSRWLKSFYSDALGHLKISPASPPNLTIFICDRVSTGDLDSFFPWKTQRDSVQGEKWILNNEEVYLNIQNTEEPLNIWNKKTKEAYYWVPKQNDIPGYIQAAPFKNILHNWLLTFGMQMVHGAAVGYPDGGVLIVGKGGSGKSTSALSCLQSPLFYAGDDYCLLSSDDTSEIFSLFNSAKVDSKALAFFPYLNDCIKSYDYSCQEKAVIFVQEHFPSKVIAQFPLKAVLIPRVTGKKHTNLRPATPAEGLKALAPSTIFQLVSNGQMGFQIMSKLVRRVPCFFLEAGTDITEIPKVISDLILNGNR